MKKKDAVVVHSGGMDSSICLAAAIDEFGKENVLSLSFCYNQRHFPELKQAEKICRSWQVDHVMLNLNCMQEITDNALMNPSIPIKHLAGKAPNTLVVGRNGLMAHLAGIHANHLGACCIYMGVIELDSANSGYRDCSRRYMDLQQEILRIDLDCLAFEIRTPLIKMTKKETLEYAAKLGVLNELLIETITCYEGLPRLGCEKCPACLLRNEGLMDFAKAHPEHPLPYLY